MRDYQARIIGIFIGIFSLALFGLAVALGYLGANSFDQMRFFAVAGVMAWLGCLVPGIGIITYVSHPVAVGLQKLEQQTIADDELLAFIRRNSRLPIILGIVDVLLTLFHAAIMQILYTRHGLGPLASYSSLIAVTSVIFVLLAVSYAATTLVTNKLTSLLKQACASRGLDFPVKPANVVTKLFSIFMLCFVAMSQWLVMFGFYESFYRVQEGLKAQTYELQQTVLARAATAGKIDLATLKGIADDISRVGTCASFIADRDGNMVYNPKGAVVTSNWKDIDEAVRSGMRAGAAIKLYENVHERILVCAPANAGYLLGTTRSVYEMKSNFKQFFIVNVLMVTLALLVFMVAVFSIFHSTLRPIGKIRMNLRDIATGEGDLTARLTIMTTDEVGALAEEFNLFLEKIELMITDMRRIIENLHASTREVASGSDMLSHAMQQQAAAVEEIVATLNEVTISVKQNSSNASIGNGKAQELVNSARIIRERTVDITRSMAEISDFSRKISEIITTVEEVSFQTNILALNAAVEAARAGEHGKGFAVVADEVRALARRTADAAGKVKTIIETMTARVSNGKEVVSNSEDSLETILSQIDEVSQAIQEITLATTEQATSILALNKAIMVIDKGTQGAAATAEELASASQTLNTEGAFLEDHARRFKVSDSAGDGIEAS